tara:strand:- start:275 stop:547 length:273 start_codon:yes stop_codon:yes gene_type:complete
MSGDEEIKILEINGKLDRMADGIDVVREKQEEMADNISAIKSAIYNPDQGLYARLRALEQWKETNSRVMWIVITSIAGLASATIWRFIFD